MEVFSIVSLRRFKKATCPYPESTFLLERYNAIEPFFVRMTQMII